VPVELLRSWQPSNGGPSDCWTLGIGYGDPQPNRWPGHLVAVLPNERLLLDPTLSQANRPSHGITGLGPLLIPCDPKWKTPAAARRSDGLSVQYALNRSKWADAWKRSADWLDASRSRECVEAVCERIQKCIDPTPPSRPRAYAHKTSRVSSQMTVK
jgi:hypothetical protein